MKPFRPGEIVELRGNQYKIAATNHDGKLILHPIYVKESIADMAIRLQSTVDEPGLVRIEEAKQAPEEPPTHQ